MTWHPTQGLGCPHCVGKDGTDTAAKRTFRGWAEPGRGEQGKAGQGAGADGAGQRQGGHSDTRLGKAGRERKGAEPENEVGKTGDGRQGRHPWRARDAGQLVVDRAEGPSH